MDNVQYISKLQSFKALSILDQISTEFVPIILQRCSVETSFGKKMYFEIGLLLRKLQRNRDILYLKNT